MEMEIVFPNVNDWFQKIDGLCWRLQKMCKGQRVFLNLHKINFIKPGGGVMLVLTCLAIWNRTGNVVTLTNVRPDLLAYLQRMNFFDYDFVQTNCGLSLWRRFRGVHRSDRLIEITRVQNPRDVADFRNNAQSILEHWFPDKGMKSDRAKFSTAIMELCNNSLEHSTGTDQLGECFAVLQVYSYQGRPEISVSIGDIGIGVKSHLKRKYPQLTKSDVSFIEKAVSGLSGRLDNSGGMGLPTVKETAQNLLGKLVIRSGRGVLAVGSDIMKAEFINPFPGTQCQVILSRAC